MVKMIVDGCVNRNEFLQGMQSPKPQHCSLSSSKRKMRILSAIVQSPSSHLTPGIADHFRIAKPFHCFLEEFQCRLAITAFGDEVL